MPYFYFHLRTPVGLDLDEIGSEFASLEAAYLDAFDAIGTMTVELTRQRKNPRQYGFEITDVTGKILLEVPFAEYLDQGRQSAVPPASIRMRRIADELRQRREAAARELQRCCTLQASLQEQGALLQATMADTRRLLAEAQRTLLVFQPFRTVVAKGQA